MVSGYLSSCNLNWMTISVSHSLHYRLVLIVHLSSLELHSSDLQNIDKFYVRINEMHKNSFKNNLYGHGTMVSKLVLQTITPIVCCDGQYPRFEIYWRRIHLVIWQMRAGGKVDLVQQTFNLIFIYFLYKNLCIF